MKITTITMSMLILISIVASSTYGANCEQLTTKYIKAAQKNDFQTMLEMSLIYQSNAAVIRKNTPKYRLQQDLNALFESEKQHIVAWMFTPASKWEILEVKNMKLPLHTGKYTNGCVAYVQTKYNNYEDAPVDSGKKLKSGVTQLSFDLKSGYVYKISGVDSSVSQYWESPLRVSELTYRINKSLDLFFKTDGGSPELSAGSKEPLNKNIYINNQPLNEFLGKYASNYKIKELSGGSWLQISAPWYFEWPPNTVLPLKLKLEIVDSSTPPKVGFAEVIINDGRIKVERKEEATEIQEETTAFPKKKAKRKRENE